MLLSRKIGLLLHKKQNNTYSVQFQFRRNIDFLSCEIYEYYGKTYAWNKKTFSHWIKENKAGLTIKFQKMFPGKTISNVLIKVD